MAESENKEDKFYKDIGKLISIHPAKSITLFVSIIIFFFVIGLKLEKIIAPPSNQRELSAIENAYRVHNIPIPENRELIPLIDNLSEKLNKKISMLNIEEPDSLYGKIIRITNKYKEIRRENRSLIIENEKLKNSFKRSNQKPQDKPLNKKEKPQNISNNKVNPAAIKFDDKESTNSIGLYKFLQKYKDKLSLIPSRGALIFTNESLSPIVFDRYYGFSSGAGFYSSFILKKDISQDDSQTLDVNIEQLRYIEILEKDREKGASTWHLKIKIATLQNKISTWHTTLEFSSVVRGVIHKDGLKLNSTIKIEKVEKILLKW